MYRKIGKIIGILLVFSFLISGCSASRLSSDSVASVGKAVSAPAEQAPALPESDGAWAPNTGVIAKEIPSPSLPQVERKRIISADIQMQTVAFDEAVGAIAATVAKHSGYFENSSLYNNGYFSEGVKSRGAYYSIRVPAKQYLAFKQEVLDCAHAVNISESEQDVSEQFFDLEARLKTLRIQQDRYYALLEKADAMEDIITLERALSDVQYQIEQYTTNLQKLSGLVDYATIRIQLDEVYKVDNTETMPTTLGGRLLYSLLNATKETINMLEDLLVGMVSLIPILIILTPIGLVVFFVIRRGKRKKQGKTTTQEKIED